LGAFQFWVIATLMIVATTATLVVPLFWRAAAPDVSAAAPARRRWLALLPAAIVPLAALGIYNWTGSPELATAPPSRTEFDDVALQHARAALRGGGQTGGQNGGDLDAAIARLRARLAANPDDAAGWRLLAQSYEFQGRTAEAAAASKQAMATGGGTSSLPAMAAALDADTARLAQTAQDHRRRREFPQAVTAFAQLAKRGAMNADLWADYADALGGARGALDDDAVDCIDAALRLDPDHPKALWLRASWQTQRRDFAAALATWQRLARILPADSPDGRIIAANLEEARSNLAAGKAAGSAAVVPPQVVLRGSVRLDPKLQARVAAGAVLYIFARAADESGPPLAVLRSQPGPWPLSFELDDRNAMLPGRKLSNYQRVVVEARISASGNALAQPGDLRAVSAVLDPRTAPRQTLLIAEEIGVPGSRGS
jgi:cytochrome c-type biogenesis protein CcmH